jgi:hypothetical protein
MQPLKKKPVSGSESVIICGSVTKGYVTETLVSPHNILISGIKNVSNAE